MARTSPLEPHSVPVLSWDIAHAIGGFRLESTPEASGHKVALGRSKIYGDVAVKAHNHYARAKGESDRLASIAELGIPALTPLSVATGGLATYLVTRREHGLTHLGMLNWARTIADPDTKRELLPALEQGAQDVAKLHNAGVTHGDLHVGNMLYRDGMFIAGDVEKSNVNVSGKPKALGVQRDLHRLGASLVVGQGFLGDRSASFRAGALGDHLLAPYAEHASLTVDPQQLIGGWENAARTGRISPPKSPV